MAKFGCRINQWPPEPILSHADTPSLQLIAVLWMGPDKSQIQFTSLSIPLTPCLIGVPFITPHPLVCLHKCLRRNRMRACFWLLVTLSWPHTKAASAKPQQSAERGHIDRAGDRLFGAIISLCSESGVIRGRVNLHQVSGQALSPPIAAHNTLGSTHTQSVILGPSIYILRLLPNLPRKTGQSEECLSSPTKLLWDSLL